jgi:hypothetical protein
MYREVRKERFSAHQIPTGPPSDSPIVSLVKKVPVVQPALILLALAAILLVSWAITNADTQPHPFLKVEMRDKSQVAQEVRSSGKGEMMGRIDWEHRIVSAVGDGVPPSDAINQAQARARAKRAAIDEAYARLLETVQEVQVDATSTTRNFVNESRVVQTKVSGLIKNAEIQEVKEAADGSCQVVLRMPLTGDNGLSSIILPVQLDNMRRVANASTNDRNAPVPTTPNRFETSQDSSIRNAAPANTSPAQESTRSAGKSSTAAPGADQEVSVATGKYTSLILDAKGLSVKPALYPAIETESGDMIYDVTTADPNATVEYGLCTYKKSINEARKIPKVGHSPLVVKATKVGGKYGVNIVVSDMDGKRIVEANKVNPFLRLANVNVVID